MMRLSGIPVLLVGGILSLALAGAGAARAGEAAGAVALAADPPAKPEPPPSDPPAKHEPADPTKKLPDWWDDYQFGGYFSIGGSFAEESDGTNVKGFRLAFGPQGQVKGIVGKAEMWLSYQQGNDVSEGGDLQVYGVGFQLTGIPYYRKWVGFGFFVDHGFEYRTESPHEGFGGFFGPGAEGIFWIGSHVQITAGLEHDFGIGTRSQDVLRFSIGFGHRYWPPRVPKGVPIPTDRDPRRLHG
jgi:hypothetical protein